MLAAVYHAWLLVISDSDQVPFLRATRRARVPAESSSVGAVVRRTARILPSMSAVRFRTRNDLVAARRLDACSAPLGAPATEEATIARHANR